MTQDEFIEVLRELNEVLEAALQNYQEAIAERDFYKSQVTELKTRD